MVAVYLNSPTGSWELVGLILAMALLGGLSSVAAPSTRKAILAGLVLAVLLMASQTFAGPYGPYCDPLWRLLGWC